MLGSLARLAAACLAVTSARAEEPPAPPAPPPGGGLFTAYVGLGAGVTRQLERGDAWTSLFSIEAGLRLGRTWRAGVGGAYGFRPDTRSLHVGLHGGRAFRPSGPVRLELLAEGGVETAAPEELEDSYAGSRRVDGGRVTLPYAGLRLHVDLPATGLGLALFARSTLGSGTASAELERCFAGSCTTVREDVRFGGPAAGIAILAVLD